MWIVDTGSHKANLAPGEASLELRYLMELPRNEHQLKIAQSDKVWEFPEHRVLEPRLIHHIKSADQTC